MLGLNSNQAWHRNPFQTSKYRPLTYLFPNMKAKPLPTNVLARYTKSTAKIVLPLMWVSLEDHLESGLKNTKDLVLWIPCELTCINIDWDNVKIFDKESDWPRKGVKEAIYIRTKRSDLNKDQGRHRLTKAYNSLLCQRSRTRDLWSLSDDLLQSSTLWSCRRINSHNRHLVQY